nr:MAG TPA: hypothetical protein [Caudoviricetes sp.]
MIIHSSLIFSCAFDFQHQGASSLAHGCWI